MLDGTDPMTVIEELDHGLPHPAVLEKNYHLVYDTSEDDRILNSYQARGIDPNSVELARRFNLPLIEYLPCKYYFLCRVNTLTRIIQAVKPFVPRRRHSISNLAEFTMQEQRRREWAPISIRKITNSKFPTMDLDCMGW